MQKSSQKLEALFFAFCSGIALLAAAATRLSRGLIHPHNPRVAYGFAHLPAAFLSISIFCLAIALLLSLPGRIRPQTRPTALFIGVLAAAYCVFWLPVWLAGGFVQDDWWLLAAASIRKIISLHPTLSWYALDSVDGNFRPLGTVLYFGWLYQWFGPVARIFTFGPFAVTFFASLVAFAIVRELGYSRLAAAIASLLFLSRGVLYTVVAWTSALGDSLSILLCGLSILFILKANRATALRTALLHVLAWICFCLAALSKQSAFATPLIIGLLLYLRPGNISPRPSRSVRATTAGLAIAAYGLTSCAIFLHARGLLHKLSPYPIGISFRGLIQPFASATSYFGIVQLPDRYAGANLLPALLGIALIAIAAWLLPGSRAFATRRTDVVFTALAALSSISLFFFLGARWAAYYGCMAAFWISILLAIVLADSFDSQSPRPAWQWARFAFCLLLVTGFAEIRLEQTGLLPCGGYIWGAYGMDTERAQERWVRQELAMPPDANAILLAGCRFPDPYTSMVLIYRPAIQRIVVYDQTTQAYLVNNRDGLRPADDFNSLSDPQAYHWTTPIPAATATSLLAGSRVERLSCPTSANSP